jgi:uncharacterized protein (TIGR03086 family)
VPTDTDIRVLDARVVQLSVEVAANLTADRLALPTPCAGWSLRDLLEHMTAQHRGFAAAAAGNGDDPAAWEVRPLGAEPLLTYAESADQVTKAFSADGVLERQFSLPEVSTRRTFPGRQAIGFHLIDYIVHSWDLARSLGVPLEFRPEVLEVGLAVARAVPDGDSRLAPGSGFRPSVPVAADAPMLDRIVAMLGRSPTWPD